VNQGSDSAFILSKKEISSHSAFVSFIDKLYKVKEQKKFHKLDDIISKADNSDFISRNWILEKVSEMNV